MTWTWHPPHFGIGWLLALFGLIAVFVLWLIGRELDTTKILVLFAMAFLSRLL